MDARHRTLHTNELLELILGFLPPRDVLLSQQVSRRFQELIQNSLPLRRKLHLEPNHVAELMPIRFEPRWLQTFDAVGMGQSFIYGEINAWQTKAAGSWRDLYPCQPPPTGVLLGVPWRHTKRPMLIARDPGRGVTFGMICDALWRYGDEDFWYEGRQARFFALPEHKISLFMSRYDCEAIMVGD